MNSRENAKYHFVWPRVQAPDPPEQVTQCHMHPATMTDATSRGKKQEMDKWLRLFLAARVPSPVKQRKFIRVWYSGLQNSLGF